MLSWERGFYRDVMRLQGTHAWRSGRIGVACKVKPSVRQAQPN